MVHLIDKSALVAEIEKLKGKISDSSSYCNGWQHALRMLELSIDTLEVKEVDLEKEIKEIQRKYKTIDEYEGYPSYIYSNGIEWIAKRFFELGLKADKEKIKAKIEQLMYGYNLEADIASCENAEAEKLADIKYQLCKKILEYINSLQEEPSIPEIVDEHYWEMLGEEPVSEELCDAANDYGVNIRKGYPRVMDETDRYICNAFKAGAQWQKEQDQSTIELAEDHAMFAGMEKMKEQMMKDAIDGEIFDIFYPNGDHLEISAKIPEDKFQDGDKVKLIIIKKE